MVHRIVTAVCLTVGVPLLSTKAHSCWLIEISNVEMVKVADAIVRARAVEYAQPPRDPSIVTTGVPDSRVRFKVIETLSGQDMNELVLPGYLVSTDDFNDRPAPYTFVRPGGRAGSCFANSYRRDAQYLLFLKKTAQGDLTVNWATLAPVNEQLRSAEDPWLTWVRQQTESHFPPVVIWPPSPVLR